MKQRKINVSQEEYLKNLAKNKKNKVLKYEEKKKQKQFSIHQLRKFIEKTKCEDQKLRDKYPNFYKRRYKLRKAFSDINEFAKYRPKLFNQLTYREFTEKDWTCIKWMLYVQEQVVAKKIAPHMADKIIQEEMMKINQHSGSKADLESEVSENLKKDQEEKNEYKKWLKFLRRTWPPHDEIIDWVYLPPSDCACKACQNNNNKAAKLRNEK